MKGHWYCSCCNDVKFLPAPAGESTETERCPDCRNNSLVWVHHVAPRRRPQCVSAEVAAEQFGLLKRQIQEGK